MTTMTATASNPLTTVQQLLDAGKAQEAVAYLRKAGAGTLELTNALGVALMRAGDVARAVEIYRRLCIDSSGFVLKPNLSPLLKANYATALLLAHNAAGCRTLLKDIARTPEPYARQLAEAVERWRRAMSWWQRAMFYLYGSEPPHTITLDFPPGTLCVNRAA